MNSKRCAAVEFNCRPRARTFTLFGEGPTNRYHSQFQLCETKPLNDSLKYAWKSVESINDPY